MFHVIDYVIWNTHDLYILYNVMVFNVAVFWAVICNGKSGRNLKNIVLTIKLYWDSK